MTARILTAQRFALAVSRAIAQTGPSAGEMPPDQQAYTEANKIADPEKKIAALGKLKTDFPDGVYASLADSQILEHADPEDAGTEGAHSQGSQGDVRCVCRPR